jgi:hypothetical protein
MMNWKECVKRQSWPVSKYDPSMCWKNTDVNGGGIIKHSIPAVIHLKSQCHKIPNIEHTFMKKSPKSAVKRKKIWTAMAAAF